MKKEQKRKISKEEKGITLIALVITIIILLILAGVTLNAALSENGLFKKAKYAAEEYNQKAIEEEIQLLMAEKELDAASSNGKADITDVLEKVAGTDGEITKEDIEKFNEEYLGGYDQKIEPVESAEDLKSDIESNPDGIFVQTGDITEQILNESIGGEGTINEDGSIQSDNPFTGVYDGNGHTIESLNITDENGCAGMFGVNEGTIKDVTIEDCEVSSEKAFVGGIVGENRGTIEGCVIQSGKVNSDESVVGGICGHSNGIVKNCENYADVYGYDTVGGICGSNDKDTEWCRNYGSVSGVSNTGGVVGYGTNISYCVNNGEIEARNRVEWNWDQDFRWCNRRMQRIDGMVL